MTEEFSISHIGFDKEKTSTATPSQTRRRQPLANLIHIFRLGVQILRFLVIGNNDAIRILDEQEQSRRRRIAQTAGGMVLFVLAVAVTVGWRLRIGTMHRQHIMTLVERSQYAVREARLLSSVDLSRARAVLDERIRAVEEALNAELDEQPRDTLTSMLRELREAVDDVSRVHRVTPSDYLDLSLVRDGTSGSVMDVAHDTLFVLDREDGVVLSVSTITRASLVVGGGEILERARSLAAASDAAAATFDEAYVLTDDEVVAIDASGRSSARVVSSDGQWQDAEFIAVYGGNVYVLDQGVSELYKYAKEADGFGQRQRWLAPGVTADFSKVLDLAIDGRVWILQPDGVVLRFDRGGRTNFRIQPIDEFAEPVVLAVPLTGTNVWILDRVGKRVVAFDRESGAYVGQWVSDVLADAVDIAIDEEHETLFILTGEAISTISLADSS